MKTVYSADTHGRIQFDPGFKPYRVFIDGTCVNAYRTLREAKDSLERRGHPVHDWDYWKDPWWWLAILGFLLVLMPDLIGNAT